MLQVFPSPVIAKYFSFNIETFSFVTVTDALGACPPLCHSSHLPGYKQCPFTTAGSSAACWDRLLESASGVHAVLSLQLGLFSSPGPRMDQEQRYYPGYTPNSLHFRSEVEGPEGQKARWRCCFA